MLDTNICIDLIKNNPPNVLAELKRHDLGEVGVSSISAAELAYGVAKSGSERNRAALERFLLPLEITPFDEKAAWYYGDLRSALEQAGTYRPARHADRGSRSIARLRAGDEQHPRVRAGSQAPYRKLGEMIPCPAIHVRISYRCITQLRRRSWQCP